MTESIFGIQQYQSQNSLQTDKEYGRMLKVLTKAMQGELTQRQYDCMYAYYFENKTQVQIAKELGIGAPTVNKHMKKSERTITEGNALLFSKTRMIEIFLFYVIKNACIV